MGLAAKTGVATNRVKRNATIVFIIVTSITSKALLALVIIGLIFTVRDWHIWRAAELARLGQGTGEVKAPAMPLAKPFQSPEFGFRVSPPVDWEVIPKVFPENFWARLPQDEKVTVVSFTNGTATQTVWTKKFDGDLPHEVDAQEGELPPPTQAREFLSSEQQNFTVLTWGVGGEIHQLALAAKGKQLVGIESVVPNASWLTYALTFLQVDQSLIFF